MRRAFGVGLSVIALFGVTACGGGQGSAEELGQTMAEAFTDQDTDTLVDLACEKDKAKAERMDLKQVFGSALEKDFEVSFVKAVENGESGLVTLKLTVEGKSENEDFPVLNEDGDWTICDQPGQAPR